MADTKTPRLAGRLVAAVRACALAARIGRGERIRTSDFYLPKVALYQAELHPDGIPHQREPRTIAKWRLGLQESGDCARARDFVVGCRLLVVGWWQPAQAAGRPVGAASAAILSGGRWKDCRQSQFPPVSRCASFAADNQQPTTQPHLSWSTHPGSAAARPRQRGRPRRCPPRSTSRPCPGGPSRRRSWRRSGCRRIRTAPSPRPSWR